MNAIADQYNPFEKTWWGINIFNFEIQYQFLCIVTIFIVELDSNYVMNVGLE